MDAHPEIISIIKKRDDIHHQLYITHNYPAAVEGMLGLMGELKKKDRVDSLFDQIKREVLINENNRSRMENEERSKSNAPEYRDWLVKLNDILWDGKYLENKTYDSPLQPDTVKF